MNDNDKLADKRHLVPQAPQPAKANLPLGDKLRNLINPALDDSRRQTTQLAMLDQIFAELGQKLELIINRSIGDIFNQAARVENNGGDDARNMFMIKQLTDHEGLSTLLRMGLPINTAFLEFSPQDIKELPGYIALHEKARDLNIAVKLLNITMDENKSPSGPQPAMLIVDLAKSYEEGAMENATLYPQLPAKKVEFDRHTGNGFSF